MHEELSEPSAEEIIPSLPQLTTKEIVDLIREDIEGFTEIYQPFEPAMTYYGGQPIYANTT